MLRFFYPYEYADSVYDIDYKKLYEKGFRAVIFDIDNTLVHHGDDPTPRTDRLFAELSEMGYKTFLLSDNDKERIERFTVNTHTPFIELAGKPHPENFIKAVKILGEQREKTLYIGDQIFTDILGANLAKIPNILVHFIFLPGEKNFGRRRQAENIILKFYKKSRRFQHRLGEGVIKSAKTLKKRTARRNFCDLGPWAFKISEKKETYKRYIEDIFTKEKFAHDFSSEKLPVLISSHSSGMIKRGKGIDPVLQTNKVVNIKLASEKISGIIIHPGETFSFWRNVGKISRKKGYKDGRVLVGRKLIAGIGGGLCNLGNTINLLVLHSPMTITEFHTHSDALAPDKGKRVPLSAGTAVSYNYIDYRFRNDTDADVQLILNPEGDELKAELRSTREFPLRYEIIEEGHHFSKEGDKFFRISKIYRLTYEKDSGELIDKKLIIDNHSEVMFDYDLIPPELIK